MLKSAYRRFEVTEICVFLKRGLRLSWIVGLLPVGEGLGFSRARALRGAATLGVVMACILRSLYKIEYESPEMTRMRRNETDRTVQVLEAVIVIASQALLFLYYLARPDVLRSVFEDLERLDGEARAVGVQLSYNSLPLLLSGSACLLLASLFALLAGSYLFCRLGTGQSLVDSVALGVAVSMPLVLVHFLSVPIYWCLEAMRRLFVRLKESLSGGASPNKLETLAELHGSLCDVARKLDGFAGFVFLVQSALTFLTSVVTLYIFLSKIIDPDDRCSTPLLVSDFLWIYIWGFQQLFVVTLCVLTSRESKEFNRILVETMIEDRSKRLVEKEKLQLHIAMKREASFSALGLFPIDFTLVHSMTMAGTTYLVMLVQFDQMNN